MAGLRGASTTRKSSRLSSPVTISKAEKPSASNDPVVERVKPGSKTFLDNWVEPPLRAPVPSFEDHRGLERVGVLEHLQPLGQPPTQKFLQKLKLAPPKPGRATPVPSEDLGTPTNGVEETSTASPVEERQESQPADEPKRRPDATPPLRVTKENDDEYRPAAAPPSTVAKSKTSTRKSVSIPPTPLPTGGYIYHGRYHPETIKQHVEAAVKRAESQRPELVPGLRKLCADSEFDPALWAVLDAVLNQSPNKDQYKTFRRYIRTGKKEYSRNSTPTGQSTSLEQPASNRHATPPQVPAPELRSPSSTRIPKKTSSSSQSPLQAPQILHPQPTQPISALHTQPASRSWPPRPSSTPQARLQSPEPVESESSPVPSLVETKQIDAMATETTSGTAPQTATLPEEGLQSPTGTSRERSRSASSSSSLSSAKSLDAETFAPAINQEAQLNGTRPAAKSALDQRQAATHKAAGAKSRGPKLGLFSVFPNTNKTNAQKRAGSDIDELELSRRKQRFQQSQGFHEEYDGRHHAGSSSERSTPVPASPRPTTKSSTTVPAPVVHPHRVTTAHSKWSLVASSRPDDLNRGNGSGRKRTRDEPELDEQETQTPRSSPGAPPIPPTAGAASISRPGTPRGDPLPLAKRVKKSARVMVSPNKPKNGGGTAGVARAGPGRESTAGNGAESSEEENNDYCAACGGNGQLLCCDGCPNSFHFSCLDPPMKGPPEGSWYCVRCVARQPETSLEANGMLGRLLTRSVDINPTAFGLPFSIRDYFDSVRTGDEGEYEDVGMPRTQTTDVKMNRAGFIEEPDYKKLKDARGNIIYCYRCRLTSNGKRDIIPCDFCPTRWHLDCLDPPLAVPPRRRNGDKPNATWRCPLHIDGDLRNLGNGEGHVLGSQPRHRVPKNPVPRDVSMSRGFRNHGVIDVELMKDHQRIDDVDMNGTIYRLPEQGIRLDFLDRVRRARYEDAIIRQQYISRGGIQSDGSNLVNGIKVDATTPSSAVANPAHSFSHSREHYNPATNKSTAVNTSLRAKTLREQQAVLSLQLLAQQQQQQQQQQDQAAEATSSKSAMSDNRIAELTNQLVLEAGEAVVQLVGQEEMQQLEGLKRLIDMRINVLQGSSGDGDGDNDDAAAAAAATSIKINESNGSSDPVLVNGHSSNGSAAADRSRARRGPGQNSEPPPPPPPPPPPLPSSSSAAGDTGADAKPTRTSTSTSTPTGPKAKRKSHSKSREKEEKKKKEEAVERRLSRSRGRNLGSSGGLL